MKINLTPTELIDQLRSWFHPKDRVVVIPTTLTAAIMSGSSTLAMALIDEKILTASATNITFASIPQNFRRLVLFSELRSDVAAEQDVALWSANGDVGNNYDRLAALFVGNNTSSIAGVIATSAGSVSRCAGANARANNFEPSITIFHDYSQTDREKWSISLSTGFGNVSATSDMNVNIFGSRWRSTSQVTAITLTLLTGPNFVSGSRATLYGLL